MPLTLIRRPRSPKVLHDIIRTEVRAAYKDLGDEMIQTLKRDIAAWLEQPEFFKTVNVGMQRWFLAINWDRKTKIGEIYGWVDEGTGSRGGGEAYDIFPLGDYPLRFTVPHFPKTVSTAFGPGIVMESGSMAEVTDVVTGAVLDHPGIEPREFTQSLRDYYESRTRIGGFRSVTSAAIKRGCRKIG